MCLRAGGAWLSFISKGKKQNMGECLQVRKREIQETAAISGVVFLEQSCFDLTY